MPSIGAIILAGGKSSRMGQDKANMYVNGVRMIDAVITAVSPFVSEILISTNNDKHAIYNLPLVFDEHNNKGPLAGIQAGLLKSTTESCIVLSCDIPFINGTIIDRLQSDHILNDADITIASCNGKTHPLCGVYQKKNLLVISELLAQDICKMHTALSYFKVKILDFPIEYADHFKNVNTLDDLN